jgi:hypothetical protein
MVGMEGLTQSWENFWDAMLDSKLVLKSPKQSSPSHCGHWLEKSTLVTPQGLRSGEDTVEYHKQCWVWILIGRILEATCIPARENWELCLERIDKS